MGEICFFCSRRKKRLSSFLSRFCSQKDSRVFFDDFASFLLRRVTFVLLVLLLLIVVVVFKKDDDDVYDDDMYCEDGRPTPRQHENEIFKRKRFFKEY